MSNTVNPEVESNTKDPFKIVVDEHETFDYIMKSAFTNTTKFCELACNLFRGIFADFYGLTFEVVPGTNNYMVSAYFDHIDHGDDRTAVSKDAQDINKVKNTVLRSTRNYARRLTEGDKYQVTEDGASALADFLFDPSLNRGIYTKDGDVNWNKLCSEVADGAGYGAVPRQLTKISFIDPTKLAAAIYGSEDENGNKLVYGVDIKRSMPSFNTFTGNAVGTNGFILQISVISESKVIELCNEAGICFQNNLNIIR